MDERAKARTNQVGERRPIGAREWSASRRMAHGLARGGVSPNAISVAGMICGVAAGMALGATPWLGPPSARAAWLGAAALIQLRLLANLFDGMVAIETGTASPKGELYNEVPDRVSDTAILVGAGYAAGGVAALGYLAALAAMATAYIRVMGRGLGTRQEFCGPMAKQQRMFVMTLVGLYLGLAPASWQPVWGAGGRWGLAAAALGVIAVGAFFTAVRRLNRISRVLTVKEARP
ncbi:CDP-alcohol phosphatidyltransferase family protein [Tautonia sp. JC769]|uniref:CDP-alcohol phosphatidyltransferase family protein n=1 Tax=Tautonia sp. JC769 TaxID=3232135 RepID=UPI003458611F